MLGKLGVLVGVLIIIAITVAAVYWYEGPPGKRAFINGQVLTMDAQNTIAEAVVIDDGKIVAIGSKEDVRPHIDDKTTVRL